MQDRYHPSHLGDTYTGSVSTKKPSEYAWKSTTNCKAASNYSWPADPPSPTKSRHQNCIVVRPTRRAAPLGWEVPVRRWSRHLGLAATPRASTSYTHCRRHHKVAARMRRRVNCSTEGGIRVGTQGTLHLEVQMSHCQSLQPDFERQREAVTDDRPGHPQMAVSSTLRVSTVSFLWQPANPEFGSSGRIHIHCSAVREIVIAASAKHRTGSPDAAVAEESEAFLGRRPSTRRRTGST